MYNYHMMIRYMAVHFEITCQIRNRGGYLIKRGHEKIIPTNGCVMFSPFREDTSLE